MPSTAPGTDPTLVVTEIFHSLQGESSLAGLRFAFIRLTGCDLRCSYCDSEYAFTGGTRKTIGEILAAIQPYSVKNVLVTGGEPLLQKNTPALVEALLRQGYQVSIETHGEISVAPALEAAAAAGAVTRDPAAGEQLKLIMDIKTPGSGLRRATGASTREGWRENLGRLRPWDEVKFVITSREDYSWARSIIESRVIPTREILISPVFPAEGQVQGAGDDKEIRPLMNSRDDLQWLSDRILEDHLPVRMQLQLHKLIWGPEKKGV